MNRFKILFFLLFGFSVFSAYLIPVAYGSGVLNMTTIAEGIGDNLGVGSDVGGLIASAVLIGIVVIPLAIYEKRGVWLKLIMGLVMMGICVAFDWLPVYFMLIPAIFVALMLSGTVRKWMAG